MNTRANMPMNTTNNTAANPGSNIGSNAASGTGSGTQSNKELLLQEINAVTAETAALMKHATDAVSEQGDVLRESVEQRYHALQERFHVLQTRMTQQAREAARVTDQYVHAHPWQSVGVAAASGLVAGLIIGTWMRRS